MTNLHKQEQWQNYVLKVDINCCKKCPKKLKKGLLKLNGIKSVHVDAKLNLVSIKTHVDLEHIINTINEWGKEAELLHGKENNLHSYRVELNDDDEQEETPSPPVSQHKYSSSSSCNHSKTKSKSKIPQEWPGHICRDKYCTVHKRDMYTNYVGNYSPPYPGNIGYNFFPRMRSSYWPPPPPPPGYYGQRMMPPYGGYEVPMNMAMPDGFAGYSGDKHSNGCNIM